MHLAEGYEQRHEFKRALSWTSVRPPNIELSISPQKLTNLDSYRDFLNIASKNVRTKL